MKNSQSGLFDIATLVSPPHMLKEKQIEAFHLRRMAVQQSDCHVLSSTILPNAARRGQHVAIAQYQCTIADIRYSLVRRYR